MIVVWIVRSSNSGELRPNNHACDNVAQRPAKQSQTKSKFSSPQDGELNCTSLSKARAVTLDVFRVSEHAWFTDVTLVVTPVLFPLAHVVESGAKLFTTNPLNNLLAAITRHFDCFNCWSRKVFSRHKLASFRQCQDTSSNSRLCDCLSKFPGSTAQNVSATTDYEPTQTLWDFSG